METHWIYTGKLQGFEKKQVKQSNVKIWSNN